MQISCRKTETQRILSTILLGLLCLSSLSIFLNLAPNTKAQQSTQNSWPMFHHDLMHTGYSTSKAPITNHTLWTFTTEGDVNDPAVVNGVVFIGSYDCKVYALQATDGRLIWSYTTGGYVDTSPTVVNGVVFVNSNDNKTYAFNSKDGALIWSYTTKRRLDSSPTVAYGEVFSCSADRNVYALNATNGELIWNFTTGGVIMLSSPAVANNAVFVGAGRNIYSLNATNGNLIWNYTVHGGVDSSPAVANNLVFVGSADHNIYAFNAFTGALVWNYTTGGYVDSGPAVAGGAVFVGSADHNVYALNVSTGSLIWNFTTGNVVASSPAVVDNTVFVGSLDQKVYALNATNGALIWSYLTGGLVVSSPAASDNVIYLGSWDHKVYAFGTLSKVNSTPDFNWGALALAIIAITASATSACILFVFGARRRKQKTPQTDPTINENPKRQNVIQVGKFEIAGNTLKFFAAKGFPKKQWTIVKEIPIYEITSIENFGNELTVTRQQTTDTFLIKERTELSKLQNEISEMLETHRKSLDDNQKTTLTRNELLGAINASIPIIDLSFDILMNLQQKRIDWQRLENYSRSLSENPAFTGQTIPPLKINFSNLSSAIKSQLPKETSNEVYNILKTIREYFDGLRSDDGLKTSRPNLQNANAVILAYCILNDLLLGRLVGDKDNVKENSQLESILQTLATETNFKVDFTELQNKMNLEGNVENIVEESRAVFKGQLKNI